MSEIHVGMFPHTCSFRSRWEAVLEDAEKRLELSASGHAHLNSFADQSVPFDQWLSAAEEKQLSLSSIPGMT